VSLALRLNFANTADQIMLGAVGVAIQHRAECCETIADLKTLGAGVVPCVMVLGYHASGDGGGGDFYWDASANEQDNAGTIIVPAANPPTGRWKRLVDGPLSVKWFGAEGKGMTNDQPAIQAAVFAAEGRPVFLPAGTYRIDSTITWLTSQSDQYAPGMKLIGEGMDKTIIASAFSNGPALKWDVANTTGLKFTVDSLLQDLQITTCDGTINASGIYLVAAWFVRLKNVRIKAMTGKGIEVPLRTDIKPKPSDDPKSDYYQVLYLDLSQCWIGESSDWGVYFGAGQSPGGLSVRHTTIANNAGGGIYCSTGQFEMIGNVFVGNGTHGGNGGMLIEGVEGHSMVALIAQNEFDTNYNWHLYLKQAELARVVQNRFLSQTFDAESGGEISSGGMFMRPVTQVIIGNAPFNCTFENNYHRSLTGESTTADVYAYVLAAGNIRNRFINNEINPGVNSSGMVGYSGFDSGDLSSALHDNRATKPAPHTPLVVAESTSAAQVLTVYGAQVFNAEVTDPSSAYDPATGVFRAPYTGHYLVIATLTITGLSAGNQVDLQVVKDSGAIVLAHQQFDASGLLEEAFTISGIVALKATDSLQIYARQTSGTAQDLASGAEKNRLGIVGIW
jgi:hypothetical protein